MGHWSTCRSPGKGVKQLRLIPLNKCFKIILLCITLNISIFLCLQIVWKRKRIPSLIFALPSCSLAEAVGIYSFCRQRAEHWMLLIRDYVLWNAEDTIGLRVDKYFIPFHSLYQGYMVTLCKQRVRYFRSAGIEGKLHSWLTSISF